LITNDSLKNMVRKDSRGFGVVGAGSAGVVKYQDYDVRSLIDEGYRKNVIVSACISMIATSAPEAPLRIYKETTEGLILDENHWFNKLIKKPNDAHSSFELWEYVHTYLQSGGASYFELVRAGNNPSGEVLEMYPLRPDRIRVVPGVEDYIERYEYWVDGQVITYEPWEIMPVKLPDPLDEFNGLAPLKRVMRELGIDNEATDFTKTFFDNAAVPYGLLTTDQKISEPEADRVRYRWQKWFMGAKRFMVAVLGQNMKYEQMGLSFKDMEFESLRSMTETRLCAAFGVDPVLLPSWVGIKHGGKYSNYAEARLHLWQETIIPILKRIESKITAELLEEGVVAKFDLSEVKALQENENKKAERVGALYDKGIIKRNEAREDMGYDPDPDGDVYKTDNANILANNNANNPTNSNNNKNEPDDDQDDENKIMNVKKKNLNLVIKGKKNQGAAMMALYDKMEGPLKKDLIKFFKKSKKDLVQILDKKQVNPEQMQEFQNRINELAAAWHDNLIELSTVHIRAILQAGGSLAAGMMGLQFNGTSPEVVKYLENYVPTFVQRFNERTKNDLQAVLIKAQVEGWALPRLKDEMKRVFNQYEYNRTDMVARSEVVRSSNAGAQMAYRQAEIQELEWLDTDDKHTCILCKSLDGKRIGIEGTFLKVGETLEATDADGNKQKYKNKYEPVSYPPLHPNCRCTIIPVVED
jgi:HK97 family phage portal protein